jgi:hypothetical protein
LADTPSTGGLLAPRTAATYPDFVHPNQLANGYANMAAQIQDAMSMPSRYPSSPFWGNGAGRFAYGTAPYGTPAYGNPAGRNAPWYVTGANGQGGQYPNPGTILGQPPQIPGGLLGGTPKQGGGVLNSQPGPVSQPTQTVDNVTYQSGQVTPNERAQLTSGGLPAVVNYWNSLPDNTARSQFLQGTGGLGLYGLLPADVFNAINYNDPGYDIGQYAHLTAGR